MMILFVLLFVAALAILPLMRNRGRKQQLLPPSPPALPIIGHLHLLGPLLHQSFRDISSRYGPLVYLQLGSVPCVVASSPDLAMELLKTNEVAFSSREEPIAIQKLAYHSTFVNATLGPYWKFMRKLSTAQLFGSRMLNQFQAHRTKELHFFLQFLLNKSEAGESVNLTHELLKLANSNISQMMLGRRCCGTDSQAEEVRNLVQEVTLFYGTSNFFEFIWLFRNLDLMGYRKKIDGVHKRHDALLEKLIKEKEVIRGEEKPSHDKGKDFVDKMLDILEEQNLEIQLTRNHIKALILELFAAATDTSAITIEWGLAELINHPQALEKARKEIDQVVGKTRLVGESDVHGLHYIQAIIKETLRLHPPIPMVPRKSTEDCVIRGYRIPANTVLFVNAWAMGRDPKYWKNSWEFLPERFLPEYGMGEEESRRDFKGHNFEFLPFGTGRRGCPGVSMAVQILPLTLAAIIQCFDLKVVGAGGNGVDMTEGPGLTTPRKSDLVCIPVARLPEPLRCS